MVGKKATALIKPYLRKFVLQIHPDYFSGDHLKRKVNEVSFQRLQTILNSAKGCHEDIRLEFYNKSNHKRALEMFSQTSSDWMTVRSFLNLCKQLGIKVMPSDSATVEQLTSHQQPKQHLAQRSLTEEFAEAFYRDGGKTAKMEWAPHTVLHNPLLMFHHEVDKSRLVDKLCRWLPHLRPKDWWGKLPTVFIPPASSVPEELGVGILILKSDMQCADIAQYLDENLDRKMMERAQKNKFQDSSKTR